MLFWRKNVSSFPIWENVTTFETAHGNFLIINQNKTPNIDSKNVEPVGWYCYSIPAFYTDKQSSTAKYKSLVK